MISFDPFWKMMKERKISTYKLEMEYKLSRGMINRLKNDVGTTTNTINNLCELFDCNVEDIIVYKK